MYHPESSLVRPLASLHRLDSELCRQCNRASQYPAVTALFAVCSRLGDGIFWYSLIAGLALFGGQRGLEAAVVMLVTSAVGVAVYKVLKKVTSRPRPYAVHPRILQAGAVLDRYSFPSGHTLHAVCFSTIAIHYFPELAVILLPFAMLVALSRPVLGLHYPSDVVAGALIGYSLALVGLGVAA